MCGIAGIHDLRGEGRVDRAVLERMNARLVHRGPDDDGIFVERNTGLASRRLSIIDLEGGEQPMFSEDRQLVQVCNGEIFNYRQLRRDLAERGHRLASRCDVEVIVHLYEEMGADLVERLDGQFAFALHHRGEDSLLLARDRFGINPLYWAEFDGLFVFASEVKAILEHPAVERRVDLTGLDQVLTFPGLVSPRTMFAGIHSVPAGHFVRVAGGEVRVREYWDLRYPAAGEEAADGDEEHYVERFRELFFASVEERLQADVPVGFYLSGGLDSSLIAAAVEALSNGQPRHTFSIEFDDPSMSEAADQRLMAEHVGSVHHPIRFGVEETAQRLSSMVYHCECPVRETYNACTMALSRAARNAGVKVVLTGEGADEMFAGYVGYRFDTRRRPRRGAGDGFEAVMEEEMRRHLWGDPDFFYEKDYHAVGELKKALYSPALRRRFEDFDCLAEPPVDKEKLRRLHPVHRRSYLDFKLRLADHLLTDHGDRMALANSVEARHPFLDRELIDLAIRMPPDLKLKGLKEKYVVRQAARGLIPERIVEREKFGWFSAGTPEFLQRGVEWVDDQLSEQRIRRQGYFDPTVIEHLKARYGRSGFQLDFPFEDDLLAVVLTFGLLLDHFDLPNAT